MRITREVGHTQGPWHAITTNTERGVHTHYIWPSAEVDSFVHCRIASVYGEENARLIAAAPELLEALKAILADLKTHQDRLPPIAAVCELWAMGQDAISKAEGGQS